MKPKRIISIEVMVEQLRLCASELIWRVVTMRLRLENHLFVPYYHVSAVANVRSAQQRHLARLVELEREQTNRRAPINVPLLHRLMRL